MEKIIIQEADMNTSKFVFCSSNRAHFEWLDRVLDEWRIKQQELASIDTLIAKLTACRPQLLLLDFSGNCGSDLESCNATMTALARQIKQSLPDLHVVAVGTMDYPDGAIAALRAGVHHFVDMQTAEEEAREVIRSIIIPPQAARDPDPCTLIALAGARAGVGTTTMAAHLADILQQRTTLQQTVPRIGLLDLGLPAGDGQLYLNAAGNFYFADALQNRHRLDQTLIQTALPHTANGVRVISLPRATKGVTDVAAEETVSLLAKLRPHFDVLLVDLGGFTDTNAIAAIAHSADQTWLVTDQSVGALMSLAVLQKELDHHEVDRERLQLIVSRYDVRYGMSASQIAERFELPLKAALPECALRMISTANLGKLLHEITRSDPYVCAIQKIGDGLLKANTDRRSTGAALPHWLQRWMPAGKNKRGRK